MADKPKRLTIQDVAREAKVSAATVSRVLSRPDYPVKEPLRRRILKTVERLNYRPNIFGQVLKRGVNKIIGVILPSLTNPFYSQLAADTEKHCLAAGYLPIICSSASRPQLEEKHLDALLGQQVAGIILSTINSDPGFFRRLSGIAAPCVLFDQTCPGFAGCSVSFDFRQGGFLATRHLIACGHRHIVFASPPIDRASRQLRYDGYRDAMRNSGPGLGPETAVVAPRAGGGNADLGDYDAGGILACLLLARREFPEAVLAVNDITAIGIMNALVKQGVRVPDDLSIMGFDDISFAAMLSPELSTVRQSTARTAESAVRMLLRRIADPSLPPEEVVIEPEIVERESVRRA